MNVIYAVIGCLLLLCQCKQDTVELPPTVAALVGTWTLMQPDSAASTTLVFSLDTANPPHDIVSFYVKGKGLQNTYTGRMYATVDGTMQLQELTQTASIDLASAVDQINRLYLTKLGSTARFNQLPDGTLQLFFGSPSSGKLSYKKSR